MQSNWNYPTQVIVGAGRLTELGNICVDAQILRPLIVTDAGISSLPFFENLISSLNEVLTGIEVYDRVEANPNEINVAGGVDVYKNSECNGVIALGGGSALDAGKAIALMVGQKLPIWDFEDVGDNWTKVNEDAMAPIIAIPTTAGTGSEVGRASVITDSEKKLKKIIFHPKMLPQTVILDPEITIGLPPFLTAATGLDALSHCLEAYCANYYHPMADGVAIEGMRLIKENLLVAFKDGTNIEARTNMLVASSMGATAFQKGLGGMHAIAHSLGGLYGSHHGLLNAVLMPYVLVANKSVIEERISRLAFYLELPSGSFQAFLDWVLNIRSALQIPHTLSEIFDQNIDIDRVARLSVEDPSATGNPIEFSIAEYASIIQNAWDGILSQ